MRRSCGFIATQFSMPKALGTVEWFNRLTCFSWIFLKAPLNVLRVPLTAFCWQFIKSMRKMIHRSPFLFISTPLDENLWCVMCKVVCYILQAGVLKISLLSFIKSNPPLNTAFSLCSGAEFAWSRNCFAFWLAADSSCYSFMQNH